MYKYRRLSREELEILKDSFIRFLAAQSVTAQDWERIRSEDPERTMGLIDQFSDVVLEKTLHNVKIIEQRSERRILYFEFHEDHASLIGMEFQAGSPLNLQSEFSWEELHKLINNKDYRGSFISGRKKYTLDRNREVFDILQQGGKIVTDTKIFNSMLKIYHKHTA